MRLFRSLLPPRRLKDAGRKAREEHSRWLTQALLGPSAAANHPRIPTRRVDRGGFDRIMADPRGRRAAQRWWANHIHDNNN